MILFWSKLHDNIKNQVSRFAWNNFYWLKMIWFHDGTFEKKKPRHSDDVVSKNNTNIVYITLFVKTRILFVNQHYLFMWNKSTTQTKNVHKSRSHFSKSLNFLCIRYRLIRNSAFTFTFKFNNTGFGIPAFLMTRGKIWYIEGNKHKSNICISTYQ